jgi:hypothetical protein
MFSSEALRHVWRAHKVFVAPRGRSQVEVSFGYRKFMDWADKERKLTDPMEHLFRRAAAAEYGQWAWEEVFAPASHRQWTTFIRRIRRNGPSLKKKHARYRRIWIAALALRLKE